MYHEFVNDWKDKTNKWILVWRLKLLDFDGLWMWESCLRVYAQSSVAPCLSMPVAKEKADICKIAFQSLRRDARNYDPFQTSKTRCILSSWLRWVHQTSIVRQCWAFLYLSLMWLVNWLHIRMFSVELSEQQRIWNVPETSALVDIRFNIFWCPKENS